MNNLQYTVMKVYWLKCCVMPFQAQIKNLVDTDRSGYSAVLYRSAKWLNVDQRAACIPGTACSSKLCSMLPVRLLLLV